MKNDLSPTLVKTVLQAFLFATAFFQNWLVAQEVEIGKIYDVAKSVELRSAPNESSSKKINEKASRMLKSTIYLSIDSSTTVKAHASKDGWVEVQVVEPEHLRGSHRGWVPVSALEMGETSKKLNGWIRHTCKVYKDPILQSDVVGLLSEPSSVGVADDGSGWLRLIHGPVKDAKTFEYIDSKNLPEKLYIEKKNFTEIIPGKW